MSSGEPRCLSSFSITPLSRHPLHGRGRWLIVSACFATRRPRQHSIPSCTCPSLSQPRVSKAVSRSTNASTSSPPRRSWKRGTLGMSHAKHVSLPFYSWGQNGTRHSLTFATMRAWLGFYAGTARVAKSLGRRPSPCSSRDFLPSCSSTSSDSPPRTGSSWSCSPHLTIPRSDVIDPILHFLDATSLPN